MLKPHIGEIPAGITLKPQAIIKTLMEDKKGNIVRVVKGKEKSFSIDPYKCFFYYQAKLWVIFKRKPQETAPWWFRGRVHSGEIQRSCETNDLKDAVSHAVKSWVNEKCEDTAKANRQRAEAQLTVQQVADAYRKVKGAGFTYNCGANQLRNLERVAELMHPGVPLSRIAARDFFTSTLARRFQNKFVARREKEAREKHGEDEQAITVAKAKAESASARCFKLMKGMFGDIHGSLIDAYKEHGVEMPDNFQGFRDSTVYGICSAAAVYKTPRDKLIKDTFLGIEAFATDGPLNGIGTKYIRNGVEHTRVRANTWSRTPGGDDNFGQARAYHVYQMFWAAVGGGLRSKEIYTMKKSDIQTIGGRMTFTGVGKNRFKTLEIPAQPDAVERIAKWMKADDCDYLLGPTLNYRKDVVAKALRDWMRGLGWETKGLIHQLRAYIGWKIYEEPSLGPVYAQQYMRHEKLEITEKFYVAKFAQRKSASINLLDFE
tara:strand:- start:1327 stop:2790 length:1464 start_codon:yes stop_codon:yes gene_type:complete